MNNVKCMNPWDPQSKRQYAIDGVYCTLNAGQAIGGQAHGICYAIDQQGGKSNCNVSENVMMTLCSDSHGTPHALCYAIEGNVVDRTSSKNGKGWCEDVSPTLNTQDRHAICVQSCDNISMITAYSMDALSSNSMKSSNPHSGFHETYISKCLDTSCCDPGCNQGGVVIVASNRT